jgi:D-ribose pyranase
MKKAGILNRHLAGALAMLGHTDLVVICDAGLPIPAGPIVVDLAFRAGVPSFAEIFDGLLDELVVEGATAAEEIRAHNAATTALLDDSFPDTLELIPHEDFKARTRDAKIVVRTGEAQPYANVILRCGVPF